MLFFFFTTLPPWRGLTYLKRVNETDGRMITFHWIMISPVGWKARKSADKQQPVDTVQNFAFCNGTIWQTPLMSWPLIQTDTQAPLSLAVVEEKEAGGRGEGCSERAGTSLSWRFGSYMIRILPSAFTALLKMSPLMKLSNPPHTCLFQVC